MAEVTKYFNGELKNLQAKIIKIANKDAETCINKVSKQLRKGNIQINETSTFLQMTTQQQQQNQNETQSKETLSKRRLMQKQIQSLNRKDFDSDQTYKRAKQEIIMQRQLEIRQQKQQKERRSKQTQQKVRRWSQQQRELNKKRQMKLAYEEQMREMEEEQLRKKMQQEQQQQKQQKRKAIQQKLKALEHKKIKREQTIYYNKSQSQEQLPLYKEYEKRYKQLEDERKFQEEIMKKNHKISMRFDFKAIKNHERHFIEKLEERNKRFEQSRLRTSSVPNVQFTKYLNKSEEKVREELEKKNRRWKYQEKLKQMPIQIDQAKKAQIEIQLDKTKNPLKYNFLAQKKLNDFQIYDAFKSFELNMNPKQIGNTYFEELKKKIKQAGIERSSSMHTIKQSTVSQRPHYKNYLEELKAKRPQTEDIQKDEIVKLMNYKNKDKAKKELSLKSNQLQMTAFKKIEELKQIDPKNVHRLLKKQAQIDEALTKSLKARLACLQLI